MCASLRARFFAAVAGHASSRRAVARGVRLGPSSTCPIRLPDCERMWNWRRIPRRSLTIGETTSFYGPPPALFQPGLELVGLLLGGVCAPLAVNLRYLRRVEGLRASGVRDGRRETKEREGDGGIVPSGSLAARTAPPPSCSQQVMTCAHE